MVELCIACNEEVRPRQHVITCDICYHCQHRTCGTRISLEDYRNAVSSGGDLHFVCGPCLHQKLNATATDELMEMESSTGPPEGADISDDDALDASFDLSHRLKEDRPKTVDISIDVEPELPSFILPDEPITFTVLETGSKRGGRLLVSSDGFSYGVKTKNKSSTYWTCSVRSKKMRCTATVTQIKDNFRRGIQKHIHSADLKMPLQKEISATVKRKAKDQVFRSAMDIVETVMEERISPDERFLAPSKKLLKRSANRHRAKSRPAQPKDLNVTIMKRQVAKITNHEAVTVETDITAEDLDRDVDRRYTRLEEELQETWDRYKNRGITTAHFLKICSDMYSSVQ